MDLLKLLINSNKSLGPCFMCFEYGKICLDIRTIFEIHNKCEILSVSIADMVEVLFPSEDCVFAQICNHCSDLVSELYVLLHNRKSKILIMNCLIKQLENNFDNINKTILNIDELVFNVILPSYENHQNKEQMSVKENKIKQDHTGNKTLKDICDEHTNYNEININLHQDDTMQVLKIPQYHAAIFRGSEEFTSKLKSTKKKRRKKKSYYNCNDCNYKTLSKTTLQAHINKNHLHTRPHICQICYKGFFNRSNLNEHVKTHNNEHNHTCELCGCRFIHKKSLIEHLRLHSDTRPYECHICYKKYVTSGRRSDHIKRSHLEKTECCNICNKKFSLKKELTRHMNNVHLRSL